MKRLFFALLALLSALVLVGCGTCKTLTQPVMHTSADTIFLTNHRYDSIFTYQERTSDYRRGSLLTAHRSQLTAHCSLPNEPVQSAESVPSVFRAPIPDTLFIHDRTVEYRYRLLRDTVRISRVDSIPVIKEVEVVREVRHLPPWAKILSWMGAAAFAFLLIRSLRFLLGRFI